MNEKKTITLSIFDKKYIVSTDENEQDIHRAASMIDELLRMISPQAQSNNESKIAVLAALKIATDFVKLEMLNKERAEAIDSLVNHIDKEYNG